MELGLVPAQEVKARRITEGLSGAGTLIAGSIGISDGGSIGSGIGELIDGGATCMQTDVAGTASQTVVQKSATGVLDSVAIQVMDSAVSASQLHPTTHSQDTITHPLPSLPPSSSSSPSQPSPSTDPSTQPWPAFSPNSTPLSRNFTNCSQFPVSGRTFDPNCGVFAGGDKQGDVSMDCDFSKSAEVPGQVEFRESPLVSIHAEASSNGLSESRRQSQS